MSVESLSVKSFFVQEPMSTIVSDGVCLKNVVTSFVVSSSYLLVER